MGSGWESQECPRVLGPPSQSTTNQGTQRTDIDCPPVLDLEVWDGGVYKTSVFSEDSGEDSFLATSFWWLPEFLCVLWLKLVLVQHCWYLLIAFSLCVSSVSVAKFLSSSKDTRHWV